MVHKWLCLSCRGFDLVDVRCIGESAINLLPSAVALPFNLQRRLFDGNFFSERGVSTGQAHAPLVSSILIIVLSATSQASFGATSSSITIGRYPFIRRTTARRTTHVLKHLGYWCYPGVESRSMGAWAGRCVIAHLDDCWGPFRRSQASSHRTWHR